MDVFSHSGDCNQFAMGGVVQGGGFSLFARGKGIAADHLVEATVVLLDGSVVLARKDKDDPKDLVWALSLNKRPMTSVIHPVICSGMLFLPLLTRRVPWTTAKVSCKTTKHAFWISTFLRIIIPAMPIPLEIPPT